MSTVNPSTSMSETTHYVIDDERAFRDIADDWNRLAEATNAKSVFLRHEWFDAAWQWRRQDHEMHIVCIRRGPAIIGICPLLIGRDRQYGLNLTTLSCFSVPDTQEFSFLSEQSDNATVAAAVAGYLEAPDVRWDVMHIEKLPTAWPTFNALHEALTAARIHAAVSTASENLGIPTADGWSDYYARRSRRLKKGNNLVVNRIKRAGKVVNIRCYDHTNLDEALMRELLPTLISLSAKSWKASTGLTLENAGPNAFVARLSEHALRNGWMLAWVLEIDDEPVAMELQLDFQRTVSGLRADYDSAYDEHSPGTLLNWRIIEELFSRDSDYYALGPGNNQYKLRWSEATVELESLTVFGNTFVAQIVRILSTRIHPQLRRWKATLSKIFKRNAK